MQQEVLDIPKDIYICIHATILFALPGQPIRGVRHSGPAHGGRKPRIIPAFADWGWKGPLPVGWLSPREIEWLAHVG